MFKILSMIMILQFRWTFWPLTFLDLDTSVKLDPLTFQLLQMGQNHRQLKNLQLEQRNERQRQQQNGRQLHPHRQQPQERQQQSWRQHWDLLLQVCSLKIFSHYSDWIHLKNITTSFYKRDNFCNFLIAFST